MSGSNTVKSFLAFFKSSAGSNRGEGDSGDEVPNVVAGASDAARRQAMADEGERMARLAMALFVFALTYSLAINVPFMVGEMLYLSEDDTDGALILACVSFVLNAATLLAIMAAVFHYYEDVRIKSRGLDFLIAVFTFSVLDFVFALLVMLTFLGKLPDTVYIGENAAGVQPTVGSGIPQATYTWRWTQVFVSLTLLMLNGFFSTIIARLRLIHLLFVQPSSRVLSKRKIQWTFWSVVLVFSVTYVVVAIVPAICFSYLYKPNHLTGDTKMQWGVVGGIVMIVARLVCFLYYLYKSRHMQEKLFHDRKQSLRVFVIDSLVYVAIYALLIAVGYQDVTVLMIFHGSIFHIVTFHLDAFGPVFIDLVMNHWKARHSSNSDSTTTPIPSQNQ